MEQGVDVVDLGLASTDLVYFAAGTLDAPGAMFTASHNPAQYNGIKLCLAGARAGRARQRPAPTSRRVAADGARRRRPGAGRHGRVAVAPLGDVDSSPTTSLSLRRRRRRRAAAGRGRHRQRHGRPRRAGGVRAPAADRARGHVRRARRHVPEPSGRPAPAGQPARPPGPRGRRAASTSASPSTATPTACSSSTRGPRPVAAPPPRRMLAAAVLRTNPGATILHNLICSRAVPEVVREHGGVPVRTQVGHSYIKQLMAETGAVFGGEHSAHYYFARQLPGRQRAHRVACSCSTSSAAPGSRCRCCASRSSATRRAARSTRRSTTRRPSSSASAPSSPSRPGPPRRAHRRLRLVVVQPAPVEHRAAAAAQPRGVRPRRVRRPRGRAARADHRA